jgi:hypothetical protein
MIFLVLEPYYGGSHNAFIDGRGKLIQMIGDK